MVFPKIGDIEIWRNAADLVQNYGVEAPAKARGLAKLAWARDDKHWYSIWTRIEDASEEMLRGAQSDNDPSH